jgi:O-acetyl-ADP-ribose deacetylase (regulator of RNase III)
LEECRTLGGCATGSAKITAAYQLPARHVIHAVGPVYRGVDEDAELLRGCYESSLHLAAEHGLASVAFPAISCGIYGYPIQEAAPIALASTRKFLGEYSPPLRVVFALFANVYLLVYKRLYSRLKERPTCWPLRRWTCMPKWKQVVIDTK